MLPILLRLPGPAEPVRALWLLLACALLAAVYTALAHRNANTEKRNSGAVLVVVCVVAAVLLRNTRVVLAGLPLYSYGVMLAISGIAGVSLLYAVSKREKLPAEAYASAYVMSAFSGLFLARVLYVIINYREFTRFGDMLALQHGGLVSYGGFVGAFLGSWLYLRARGIAFLPFLDVGTMPFALGLGLSRIGCYLFGCDFGRRLSPGAPGWLARLGSFPHWRDMAAAAGDGSPAYVQHRDQVLGTAEGLELLRRDASFPVHPTQLYEALAGFLLLAMVVLIRRRKAFWGEAFLALVGVYGVIRFLLEFVRDDHDRGAFAQLSTAQWFALCTTATALLAYRSVQSAGARVGAATTE
jgi:phosphatidylglycerol---prolipoprotein diacylglyceryl transferase